MPSLEDVVLEVLSPSQDVQSQLNAAGQLVTRWDQIIGAKTLDEVRVTATPFGFRAYAFTIIVHATRLFPNPLSKASLLAARQDILDRLPPSGPPTLIADDQPTAPVE